MIIKKTNFKDLKNNLILKDPIFQEIFEDEIDEKLDQEKLIIN